MAQQVKYNNEGKRIRATFALKCTCHLEERVSCSTSISVPVMSTQFQSLLTVYQELCAHATTSVADQESRLPLEVDRRVGLDVASYKPAPAVRSYIRVSGSALDRVNADITSIHPLMKLLGNLRKELNELSDR